MAIKDWGRKELPSHSIIFDEMKPLDADGTPVKWDDRVWVVYAFGREPMFDLYYRKPKSEPDDDEHKNLLALMERFARDLEEIERVFDVRFVLLEQVLQGLRSEGVLPPEETVTTGE